MTSSRLESYSSYHRYIDSATGDKSSTVFIAAIISSLATVNFGYALGYTAQLNITELFSEINNATAIDTDDISFSIFASIVALGALVGGLFGGYLVDKIGRKATILFTSLFYTPGWLMIAFTNERPHEQKIALLYIGRILTGIGVGMSSLAVPVYISEISSARSRGAFGNINQLSINFGFMVSYLIGFNLKLPVTAIIPVGIVFLNVVLMVFMPETPRWLLANNKRHEAIKALAWLRGLEYQIEEECFEIESSLGFGNLDSRQRKWTLNDLKQPTFYWPLAIALFLMFFQEFSGINCILFYCFQIFENAGIGGDIPNTNGTKLACLCVGITLFVFTGISCFLVDRIGRRKLFMLGSILMCLSILLLGLYVYYYPLNSKTTDMKDTDSKLALFSMLLYVAMFSIGWGPLPWLLMSELFPTKTRGIATSIVTFANWLFVFITTVIFIPMINYLKPYGTFWFMSSIMFFSFFFVLYFVPETKGKPLEDITDLFLHNKILQVKCCCKQSGNHSNDI